MLIRGRSRHDPLSADEGVFMWNVRTRRVRFLAHPGGFTLVEILVVIVVISVLATLVGPSVFRHVGSAKKATARSQIEMLGVALDAFRLDNGRYPTTEEGLAALRRAPDRDSPQWHGPYLRKDVPADPWGNPYVYRSAVRPDGTGFELISYGADGREGGEGDDADIEGSE